MRGSAEDAKCSERFDATCKNGTSHEQLQRNAQGYPPTQCCGDLSEVKDDIQITRNGGQAWAWILNSTMMCPCTKMMLR